MSTAVFRHPVRVYYEDTDASGVVYHANYLRWFERARTEWLRELGLQQQTLRATSGVVFTVADLRIEFRRPARLDDRLEVLTCVPMLRRASLTFAQTLVRQDEDGYLTRAEVRVGCVDVSDFRPRPLPGALKSAVEAWIRARG
ncbi:acyl-CoA thioester hydrolase [Fontimonas thermophila]|uniref:Acyl-CoA thioester hydrolase n=1 Tax=Fontimonas thermophila TaxID=1076937 RepID=A0A1I2HRZ8_9GAMM|nr:tol-pal system-associated acyl-CoA thioesterase [Fontimonas thermophila]SFF32100.1 acyl-CoA thioester hydrolase [Fontimonas thermophila]